MSPALPPPVSDEAADLLWDAIQEGRYLTSPTHAIHVGMRHLILRLCERRGRPLGEPWATRLERYRDHAVLEALFDRLDAAEDEAAVADAFAAAQAAYVPVGLQDAPDPAVVGAVAPVTAPGDHADGSSVTPAIDEHQCDRIALAVDQHLDLPVGTTGADAFEVLAYAPVLHSGWESDSAAALVRLFDGRRVGVVLDQVREARPLSAWLRARVGEYADAVFRTAHLVRALERERL